MLKSTTSDIQFLAGGGLMGQLIREKDWSRNPLGAPETWPQSLRTTLSILLNSKFPMFLFWGSELICFYNDAYRPSLGNDGKHPDILGGRGEEYWKEIWKDIKPIIDKVLIEGEASWFEDRLLPIYRNGKMEDVYWTFSYSPINDESGKPAGVFVTCSETIDKVIAFRELEESNKRFLNSISQTPVAMCVLRGKDYVVEMANNLMLEIWGKETDVVMNEPLFYGLPEIQDQGIKALLDGVYTTGEKFVATEWEIDLMRNGKIETAYVNFVCEAIRETDGSISGIIGTATEITKHVESRKKIERNEERLNIVIEASELGTWELCLQTSEITYSQRFLEIIGGYTQKIDITLEQLRKHIHPDDLDVREKALKEAFTTGIMRYEGRTIWNDKSIHWIEGKGKVFYDENKEPVKMIGTIRDITNEKDAQQLLIKNEQKFRLLADSMPQNIWTADTEGNLNYFNQSVIDYSGMSLKQIDEKGWLDIVHPDEREENEKQWMHSITTGKNFLFEHRFRRYDGEYRWQLSRAIPQKNENGEIQMWVGTSTDIQDQKEFTRELEIQVNERTRELKQVNEILQKSEERYHLMVEEVQDYAILYITIEGIVENWNKGAEKIKGYKAEEIIGKNFSTFYTSEDHKNNLPQYLLNQAAIHGRYRQEGWRVRKDGTLFWASVTITAVHNNDRKVIGFSKVTHDLTSKKEADEKIKLNAAILEQKNTELEKMNKELQSFAYISSHDLQEPLRKIQTFSDQIIERESANLSENGKDKFKRMQNAAKRMQTLINDLLAYSRTNAQDIKLTKADLRNVIEDVIEDMKEELQQRNATIEMGEIGEAHIIPFQFHQLMFNLISNSLKFSRENVPPVIKIKGEVAMGEKLNNDNLKKGINYCHITFSDNGIGFEQQYSTKIFEVFQRLHGKEVYQGTGIGLAIVKKIIDNHNGVITANSELGKGAIFDIYIPVNSNSETDNSPNS